MTTIKPIPKKETVYGVATQLLQTGYQTRSLICSDGERYSPAYSRVSRRILAYA